MARINIKNLGLSYLIRQGYGEKVALIMHGWGANKELMEQFFTKSLSKHCKQMIFLDFAGFGGSDEPSYAFNSIDYLNLTNEFIKALDIKVDILLGHSYGGKIACLMASKNDYDALILCASAGLKLPKSPKVKLKVFLAKCLNKLGFKNIRRFLASKDGATLSPIMYETFKNVVDEDYQNEISKINTKTLLLWGESDTATPLSIANKMQGLIKNSKLITFNGNHFFFMQNDLTPFIDEFFQKA
ncbi:MULTISPECIES: alpha/beta hydrolase [unclassified Campylobacter]|uniref:alpha/beta fold hydrolase n=1 Tax=unclassified Campylobacter TaxID=2593542 RepID=UPI001BDB60A2|nr:MULTISPECIES: alpha/beta hydrolase [unclassified Campylobacter]MBT0879747.1 alpha/beta hydrolase [Campylobacter sp. 2018MI27]MBT0884594.1 alpha/beta hydrolase [Campylobacter sp. 2018MI10]